MGPEEACPFPFHLIHLTQCNKAHMADEGLRRRQAASGMTDALLPPQLHLGPTVLIFLLEREGPPSLWEGEGDTFGFYFAGTLLAQIAPTTRISKKKLKPFAGVLADPGHRQRGVRAPEDPLFLSAQSGGVQASRRGLSCRDTRAEGY